MTATRNLPDPIDTASPGPDGETYTQKVADEVEALWDRIVNQVGSIGGTANAITGECSPPLIAAPKHGQVFRLVPASPNSGAVTIDIDGFGAIALKDPDGGALSTGDIIANRPVEFWYDDANGYHRLVNHSLADLATLVAAALTSSGWEKIGEVDASASSQIEITFTAGRYEYIAVSMSDLVPSSGSPGVTVTLRNASGAIVTLTGGTNIANFTGMAEFMIGLVSATKFHFGRLDGVVGSGGTILATVQAGAGNATAPDRIRVALSSGNIATGRVTVRGRLKVG